MIFIIKEYSVIILIIVLDHTNMNFTMLCLLLFIITNYINKSQLNYYNYLHLYLFIFFLLYLYRWYEKITMFLKLEYYRIQISYVNIISPISISLYTDLMYNHLKCNSKI